MAVSPLIRELVDLHRRQLVGIIEVRGVGRLDKAYAVARDELQQRLEGLARQGKGQTFEAQHLRLVLTQVIDTLRGFQGQLQDHLRETGHLAARVAPRQIAQMIGRVESHFGRMTPVVQAAQIAVVRGVYPSVAPTLLDRYRESARRYGPQALVAIKNKLALSMIEGDSVDQTVDRLVKPRGIFDGERWRAERIVRTEMSWTFGVAKQRSMEQLRPAVPRLLKRLVATRDSREGDDSKQLDGQTVPIEAPFIWVVKNSKGIPTGQVIPYMQPPNRPNDREVVIPWVADWGTGQVADAGAVEGRPPPDPDA